MTDLTQPTIQRLRLAGWGLAAALLALPAFAMLAGAEGVHWTASDFVIAAALLGGVGLLAEAALRTNRDGAHIAASLLALGAGLVTIWVELAVGVIGDGPTMLFLAVPLAAGVAGLVVRGRPAAMARIAGAAGGAMAIGLALTLAAGEMPVAHVFVVLVSGAWFGAALLYRRAAARAA